MTEEGLALLNQSF